MPFRPKSVTGPRGESCLTCRRRKKKCDKGRPFCLRCLTSKGKFICVGYDDESEPEVEESPLESCAKTRSPVILPMLSAGVSFGDAVPDPGTRSAYFGITASASEINDYLSPSIDLLPAPGTPDEFWLTSSVPIHRRDQVKRQRQAAPQHKRNAELTLSASSTIPRGVKANTQMRQSYLFFILEKYESLRVSKFFRPSPISMRDFLTAQMKRSRVMELMFLGAKIFETFSGKLGELAIQSCSRWITRCANQVVSAGETSNPYPSMQDVEDKLTELLELGVVQFIVLGTAAGYSSLRLALSSFIRLVSDDSNLWAEQPNGLLRVSLPAILSSNQVLTRRFVFNDVIYSLILGLPTLAEYDSTGFPVVPGENIPVGWVHGVHGVPIEMIVNIAEVNKWRAGTHDVDWRTLETRTLAWRWRRMEIQSMESVEMIYRAAIQEAWRHATLIYIYMGICRVNSHDTRVQASVRQIVQLMGIVNDAHMDVHFSIPSVVAGLAARHEYQRTLILRKLRSFTGARLWVFRGSDFARVLRYLWDGPALGDGPVGWDEYVQARCQVLPVQ